MTRREAIREYKERKPLRGAYAMRCAASSQAWVGSSLNLAATRNGLWFSLRTGSHREKMLQATWNAHGEEAFQYEILEKLSDDVSPIALKDLLQEKKTHWLARLGALPLL
jgi:hypothetical protein